MKQLQLFPMTLDDVLAYLQKVPYINDGGCAIAALAIYRWMKQNRPEVPVVMEYRYHSYDQADLKQNESFLNGKRVKPRTCSHATVDIDGVAMDCDGPLLGGGAAGFLIHQVNERLVLKSLRTNDWNCSFRRYHVPEIAKALDVDLSDVPL